MSRALQAILGTWAPGCSEEVMIVVRGDAGAIGAENVGAWLWWCSLKGSQQLSPPSSACWGVLGCPAHFCTLKAILGTKALGTEVVMMFVNGGTRAPWVV